MGAWDDAMLLSPTSWPPDLSGNNDRTIQPIYQPPVGHQPSGPLLEAAPESTRFMPDRSGQNLEPASTSPFSAENAPNGSVDEGFLVDTFLQMLMPPILSPVEVGPKWDSVRAFFAAMASESLIVRSAILAFAAMQLQRTGLGGDTAKIDWRPLYDGAARHLSSALAKRRKDEDIDDSKIALKYILASLFLLTYTDVSFYVPPNPMQRFSERCIPSSALSGAQKMSITNTKVAAS